MILARFRSHSEPLPTPADLAKQHKLPQVRIGRRWVA